MKGFLILIIIVLFIWLVLPFLFKIVVRWMQARALRKFENILRAQMGMPPNDSKKKKKTHTQHGAKPDNHSAKEPLIPKEYAEDVEFVETIDYSSETIIKEEGNKVEIHHESQISDVEWTEVKHSGTK